MQLVPLSPAANLGIGAVYTSQVMDMSVTNLAVGTLTAQVLGDQASAANGVKILASKDNVTFFTIAQAALVANTLLTLTAAIVFRYYKVQITNGGTAQTTLTAGASVN